MFGMAPVESTDVVVENLVKDKTNPVINTHDFTETVGIILFATYELIMMIALVNTLIAILSNTFQKVVVSILTTVVKNLYSYHYCLYKRK